MTDRKAHHVVVVEDSAPLGDAFREMLEATGYRVSLAVTLADALKVPERADVLILDLTLPDGDGLELLPMLQRHSRAPRFTFALTGHQDDVTRQRCLDAGCADVLIKPVSLRTLTDRILEELS